MKTCDHGIALVEDWCSQCKGAPSANIDRQKGYDDATCNKDMSLYPSALYLEGYKEGLEARVRWASRDLKEFNRRFTYAIEE